MFTDGPAPIDELKRRQELALRSREDGRSAALLSISGDERRIGLGLVEIEETFVEIWIQDDQGNSTRGYLQSGFVGSPQKS